MAKFIKDNRILSEEEYYRDETMDGCASMGASILVSLLCCVFLLSPGIIPTSLLNLFIDFSIGQLWACSIVISIIVAILLHFLIKEGKFYIKYIVCACISTLFIVLVSLCWNDNCFFDTVKQMFNYK